MEKIIDTVNKKAVEDMKEESPYTAFKSEKNLERAEDMEEKAVLPKVKRKSLLKTTFPTRKRKTSSVPAASSRTKSNKNNQ